MGFEPRDLPLSRRTPYHKANEAVSRPKCHCSRPNCHNNYTAFSPFFGLAVGQTVSGYFALRDTPAHRPSQLSPVSVVTDMFARPCPERSGFGIPTAHNSDTSMFRRLKIRRFAIPTNFVGTMTLFFFGFVLFCFGELSLILSKSTAIPTNSNVSIFRQNCHLTVCLSLPEY